MNNTTIKYFVFDIGNVLLKFTARDYLRTFHDNDTAECLMDEVFHPKEFGEYEKGFYSNEELCGIYAKRFPHHSSEIKHIIDHWVALNTYMTDSWCLLKELKQQGFKIYFLSTMGKEWQEAIYEKFPEFSLADGAVFSYESGANKPEEKIYKDFFSKYGLKPEEGLFFDDKKENIDQAIKLGMKGIVFKDIVLVKEQLKGMNLL